MILLAILILVIIVIAIEIKEFRKKPIIKLTKKVQRDNDNDVKVIQLKLKLCDQYKGGKPAPNSNNPPPNNGSK